MDIEAGEIVLEGEISSNETNPGLLWLMVAYGHFWDEMDVEAVTDMDMIDSSISTDFYQRVFRDLRRDDDTYIIITWSENYENAAIVINVQYADCVMVETPTYVLREEEN